MAMQAGLVTTQSNIDLKYIELTALDGGKTRGLKQGQGVVHFNRIYSNYLCYDKFYLGRF